jgi:hypothetical protein
MVLPTTAVHHARSRREIVRARHELARLGLIVPATENPPRGVDVRAHDPERRVGERAAAASRPDPSTSLTRFDRPSRQQLEAVAGLAVRDGVLAAATPEDEDAVVHVHAHSIGARTGALGGVRDYSGGQRREDGRRQDERAGGDPVRHADTVDSWTPSGRRQKVLFQIREVPSPSLRRLVEPSLDRVAH